MGRCKISDRTDAAFALEIEEHLETLEAKYRTMRRRRSAKKK